MIFNLLATVIVGIIIIILRVFKPNWMTKTIEKDDE